MADYADLSGIVGQMKRAAIDCWMADQGFYPNWGNDQLYAKWGWMLNFYDRPAEDGSGGGDGNGVEDSVAEEFAEIRAVIDSRVSSWLDLPDGSLCGAPRGAANATTALLGGSATSPTVQGGGEIATANDTVHEVVVNNLRGSFRAPFLDKYYTQFSKVAHGLGDACIILEANYAGEQAMWPAARTDVATICDAARAAWAKQAEDASAANGTLALTVVAAVAGAVSGVVTAGAGTVAAVAALGSIAALASSAVAAITAETAVSGGSYLEILESLTSALETLDETLTDQEDALVTMLNGASSTMRGDLASYNLDAFAMGDYPLDDTMTMDRSDTSIVSTNMGRVETALATASTTLGAPPTANPTPRGADVGLGSAGTHDAATDLYEVTARCLELTAGEYVRGHALFDAVVEDYFSADAAARHTVETLRADEALSSELGV
ncbi:hypothetical protein ACFM35_14370 [Microbacterium sp. P01]|uniref:hypothetical protein n=1 Tax=Microbacterium sp. P01 TaxID=3366261 RepID=UPI00366D02E0